MASYKGDSFFFPLLLAQCREQGEVKGLIQFIDATQNLSAGFGFTIDFGSSSAFNIFYP